MEVDNATFRTHLLSILNHISTASYVAFDFEMSGINTRSKHSNRSHDVGKPTLQEQYEDMRSAVEAYQVLQVGICCVEEDREKGFYLARPYNFFLSPLQANGVERLMDNLDRRFAFSSSACEFLSKNNFDFGKVFSSGVPYLSRDEEAELRDENAQRVKRNASIPDIVLASGDPALSFYRDARKKLAAWVKDPNADDWCNIHAANEKDDLNGFQRRLVHQLVRKEFPTCRTYSRCDGAFMQVKKIDPVEEAKFQAKGLEKFNEKVVVQTGLRWIFEALTNGDLERIPVSWFYETKTESPDFHNAAIHASFTALKKKLKDKKHVLVGHNLFTDLGFLYKTFVGTLPDEVVVFQDKIHSLFPVVFDTKYISTQSNDATHKQERLADALAPFRMIHTPLVILHEHHVSYGGSHKQHEAGYDSWMTAEFFAKLCSKLYADSKKLRRSKNLEVSDSESDPENFSQQDSASDSDEEFFSGDEDEPGGALLDNGSPKIVANTKPFSFVGGLKEEASKDYGGPKINPDTNPFSLLGGLKEKASRLQKDIYPRQWIPSMEHSFWDIYTNKLRVNAIEGGVFDLVGNEMKNRGF